MTEKPRTFDLERRNFFDPRMPAMLTQEDCFYGGWHARDEEIAAKDRRIAELEHALSELLTAHHHSRGDEYVDAAYAALSEPAAEPERKP